MEKNNNPLNVLSIKKNDLRWESARLLISCVIRWRCSLQGFVSLMQSTALGPQNRCEEAALPGPTGWPVGPRSRRRRRRRWRRRPPPSWGGAALASKLNRNQTEPPSMSVGRRAATGAGRRPRRPGGAGRGAGVGARPGPKPAPAGRQRTGPGRPGGVVGRARVRFPVMTNLAGLMGLHHLR